MRFPPKAYLIGAQKAGTTLLASLLAQHPRVRLSHPKEPDFFTKKWANGVAWYEHCFPEAPDALLVDASTTYSMAPAADTVDVFRRPSDPHMGVPARIGQLRPDARFIYALRDPVSRTYSGYWHSVRQGQRLTFREAIENDQTFHLRIGRYYDQIQWYLRSFPLDAFCFVEFRELTADPAGVARRCVEFLGLDPAAFDVKVGR